MKEHGEKSGFDKIKEDLERGADRLASDFGRGAGVVGSFMATQAAVNTAVQWAQNTEDKTGLLENFIRIEGEKKTAMLSGSYATVKNAADALGAIKEHAKKVLENTNQQIETGTLTRSFSGTLKLDQKGK